MKPTRFLIFAVILFIGIFTVSTYSCSKKEETTTNTVPVLSTKNASDVTNSSAQVGGVITGNGGASITERGVCYSTSSNPTIADNSIQSGSGTGAFDCEMTGLNQNTKYYFKAYAMNSVGVGYGDQKSFTTQGGGGGDLPTVSTNSATDITETSATCGGIVTNQGSSSVTVRGVCWSTTSSPTTSDSYTTDGSGIGDFLSYITGLTKNTIYYVRAYAINTSGTAYGDQITFATLNSSTGEPCPDIPTITDPRDGKVYPTVQIGSQCWLQKNMNYETGNSWCYDDDPSNCVTYGRLYDWDTFMNGASSSNLVPSGVQGVCPPGWHVPSDAEWTVLTTFLGGEYIAGGKMKEAGTTHWASPNTEATNSSGFTALPGGAWSPSYGFGLLTLRTDFWSSTEYCSTPWYRCLGYNYERVGRGYTLETNGLSARCLKD